MACDIWLRRDHLTRHGQTPHEPPCDHPQDHCPPIKETQMTTMIERDHCLWCNQPIIRRGRQWEHEGEPCHGGIPRPAAACRRQYPPSPNAMPHTRIVSCDLPQGHDGPHEEADTGATWGVTPTTEDR